MFTSTLESLELFEKSLRGSNYSEKTVRAYLADIRQFITWLKKGRVDYDNPRHLQRIDIVEFINHLASVKATGVTRARKLAAIRKFFAFMVENNIVISNPANTIKNPTKEIKNPAFLQKNEYKALLFEASQNIRDFAILQVFLQTGIRVGELVNLKTEDIDLENKNLVVRQGKGQKDRSIPLELQVIQALSKYLQSRGEVALDSEENLFVTRNGTGIKVRTIRKIVKKYIKRAGINNRASVHTLRHTFGTHKVDNGMPIAALKEVLGHRQMQTTYKYVHLAQSSLREHMERTGL